MSGVHDSIKVTETTQMRFSQPVPPDQLPPTMGCPGGHRCERVVLDLMARHRTPAGVEVKPVQVPVYWCDECQVVYRSNEVIPR